MHRLSFLASMPDEPTRAQTLVGALAFPALWVGAFVLGSVACAVLGAAPA